VNILKCSNLPIPDEIADLSASDLYEGGKCCQNSAMMAFLQTLKALHEITSYSQPALKANVPVVVSS
jgi:hypothetical protein